MGFGRFLEISHIGTEREEIFEFVALEKSSVSTLGGVDFLFV